MSLKVSIPWNSGLHEIQDTQKYYDRGTVSIPWNSGLHEIWEVAMKFYKKVDAGLNPLEFGSS